MYLESVFIENYRAVRRASLTFNQTTVLIGENESGKSSVFEAIQVMMNPVHRNTFPTFKNYHFHYLEDQRSVAGPIHIILRFVERKKEEWSTDAFQILKGIIPVDDKRKRKLEFELMVHRKEGGKQDLRWKLSSPGAGVESSNPKLLHWLRKMSPSIYLTAGMLTGHGRDIGHPPEVQGEKSGFSPDIEQYVDQIKKSAARILSDQSTNVQRDIVNGYRAAIELIERIRHTEDSRELGLGRKISEIIGIEEQSGQGSLLPVMSLPGSTAQRLGVMLLVSSLLSASPGELMKETEPIWILENPEAHLHPMTLSAITILINGIRWQKIIATYSDELFNSVPLSQVRRLTRYRGLLVEHRVNDNNYSREDLRRIGYHLQVQHSTAIFSRVWVLVEGESEFWIIPQLARLLNYDFSLEGISCMDFAQSGLTAIIRVAEELGIEWHLLADGDAAGQAYMSVARKLISQKEETIRLTQLDESDIELYFWSHGFADVYLKHARVSPGKAKQMGPVKVIRRAIKNYSKPYLALSIVKAAANPDAPDIPREMIQMIELCVRLAREAPQRSSAR